MSNNQATRAWIMTPETMEKLRRFLIESSGSTEYQLTHLRNIQNWQETAQELCDELEVWE